MANKIIKVCDCCGLEAEAGTDSAKTFSDVVLKFNRFWNTYSREVCNDCGSALERAVTDCLKKMAEKRLNIK